ncbi:MAG TPA: tetratricopeptide repeat protein [Candidatus Bathyarchaeia archaeon]|nr:tetratricopeptide repeat protein [Candidatus Bathyarchaeia archaeon]
MTKKGLWSSVFGRESFYRSPSSVLCLPFLVSCVLCLVSGSAHAGPAGDVRQGNRFYEARDYEKAVEKYNQALQKKEESDIINFNAGTGYYRLGDYDQAIHHFQKALLSEQQELRQRAHYNLGNALYRSAEKLGPQNLEATVPLLEKALGQYEEAMKINLKDEDASYNYEFVKKALEKIKEQLQKQQNQCQNPQKKENGEGKTEDGENQQEGQQERQENGERKTENGQQKHENDAQRTEDGQKQQENRGQGTENGATEERGAKAGQDSEKDLSQREAQIRLRDYEQNQQPKEMLNLRGQFSHEPVLKDW